MLAACRRFTAIVLLTTAVACGDVVDVHHPSDDPSPDAVDARAVVGGKADHLFSECHLEHLLLLVNDPQTDADLLIDHDVHHRAARNIDAADRSFRTAEALDEVPYVGPVAFQQLAGAVDPYCSQGDWRSTDTLFSPEPPGNSHVDHVARKINGATRSIDMAMYRISDHRVINALGDATARGVHIRLLFDEANGDHLATEGSTSALLEDLGVDVRYINRPMHHKFAIIDGPRDHLLQASDARFFSGSANMAYAAASIYDENTVFHRRDPSLVLTFQRQFNHLWEHSRNLEWNDGLDYLESLPIEEEMIPHRPTMEVLFTSENFETTHHAHLGLGFRPHPFGEAVVNRLVDLIHSADSSIWIASRYLRSRQIAEALLQRHNDEPHLDIRVYLDQAEYIDADAHLEQAEELQNCLDEADGDELRKYRCRERGRLFSYALFEAGVPLRFKTYAYRWHFTYAEQMHHKYMIIDKTLAATGSYNYSNNAEQNSMENVVLYHRHEYPDVVDNFVKNFRQIWQAGQMDHPPQDWMTHKESAQTIDLVFDPIALTWPQLTEFQDLVESRCPMVHTDEFAADPTEYKYCTP